MSKLACVCGNILSDSSQEAGDKLWGEIIPNGEKYDTQEKLASLLAGLCEAYKNESHINWLKDNCSVFSGQNIESIISDIITSVNVDVGVVYGKCENCGTLMVQKLKGENTYIPYKPTEQDQCEEI